MPQRWRHWAGQAKNLSNVDDGFYLQSGTDGKPLFEVIVNFKEMVGMPFIPDELEKGATEFYE